MTDTLTPNIKLTNQTEGGNNNSWGQIADANFEEIDDKLGDKTSLSVTGGSTTLTDSQEIVAVVDVSGSLVSNHTVNFSGRGGYWIIANRTTGSFSLTVKVTGQTGITIEQGGAALVYCNGTDLFFANPPPSDVAEVTVASATTTNVLGAASDMVAISGGTGASITSLGTGASKTKFCRATGTFTLVHHATTLILQGGANIDVLAGDMFIVTSDASNNARVNFARASGKALVTTVVIADIPNDLITYAKIQNVSATSRILGRKTASAGDIEELTLSELLDFIGSAAQGDILQRGASGWTRLGTGAAGQALKSAGAGADLAWGSSGAIELIQSQVASASATIDFTTGLNDTSYDAFKILLSNIKPATDNVELWGRIGTGGGPTYQTSGYKYGYTAIDETGGLNGGGTDSDVKIRMSDTGVGSGIGNASGESLSGEIRFNNPEATDFMDVLYDLAYRNASGGIRRVTGAGRWDTAGAVTGVRIMMSSGNIASGRLSLYGFKKS